MSVLVINMSITFEEHYEIYKKGCDGLMLRWSCKQCTFYSCISIHHPTWYNFANRPAFHGKSSCWIFLGIVSTIRQEKNMFLSSTQVKNITPFSILVWLILVSKIIPTLLLVPSQFGKNTNDEGVTHEYTFTLRLIRDCHRWAFDSWARNWTIFESKFKYESKLPLIQM